MIDPRPKQRSAVLAALASLAFAAAYAGCGGSENKAGGVGEDCYPNGTCNAGLDCQAGKCVASTGNGGNGGGATTSSSSGSSGSSGGTSTSSSGSTTTSSSTSAASSGATNGPPVIVMLGSNVTSITEGESVNITAIVTDPDGIADVIGGDLGDGGTATYGAFQTTSQEGAYQMTLTWAQFQQVASIDFAQGADEPRVLVATFYDQAAHSVQKSITVTLSCNGDGACAGVCKNMSADTQNCGTCGNVCPTGATCAQSACMCPTNQMACSGVCKATMVDPKNCGTCGHVCSAGSCIGGVCGTLNTCTTNQTSCNAVCQSIGKTCNAACIGLNSQTNVAGVAYQGSTTCGASATQVNIPSCTSTIATTYSEKCCCF